MGLDFRDDVESPPASGQSPNNFQPQGAFAGGGAMPMNGADQQHQQLPGKKQSKRGRGQGLDGRQKLLLIVCVAVLVLVMGFMIVRGFRNSVNGGSTNVFGTKTNQALAAKDDGMLTLGENGEAIPPADTNAILASDMYQKLNAQNEQLRAEIAELKEESLKTTNVVNMPSTVTSLAELSAGDTDVFDTNNIKIHKELLPYTKHYDKVKGDVYNFYLLVNYGDVPYIVPVHYSDYKDLRESGVSSFAVELTKVKDEEGNGVQCVTGLLLDTFWRENTKPKK